MTDSLYREYFELLQGAREHLSTHYAKGSYILAEKENWEALRRVMASATKPLAQPPQTKQIVKPVSPSASPSAPSPSYRPPTPMPQRPHSPPANPVAAPKSEPQGQPPAKRVVEDKINRSLNLMELSAPVAADFSSWKEIFADKFSQIQLIEPAPSTGIKTTCLTIVYDQVSPQELTFLQNVARTCHLLLGSTRLVSRNQFVPDSQKMVVCYGMSVENAFPMEQLSVYLQSPRLKAQLWRQLYSQFMQKSS